MGAADDDVIEVVWVVVGVVIVELPLLSAIAVAAEVVSTIVRPFVAAAAVGRGGCGGLANRPDTPKNVTRTT